ncbi:autophagy-related protein 4, putative [Plasmodium ovale]|uniref:Cysteine protease ATG4, putative n=2 Tax=Plasmodium ovale TaxID=36330 RepID=A0A1D3TMS0_PLAOA|nr:cysteine protease ATG4, putative (ATG4) [Plasmodium ovale curtisi]SCP06238.1 autophagy-related protein 4, putative [Plasmodium ovale]
MERKTDLLQNNDNDIECEQFCEISGEQNKCCSNDAVSHESASITNISKVHNNPFKKKNVNKYKNNLINTKNKNDEQMHYHKNKSKYKLVNYFNNVKHNFSIKRYFKMLVTVSMFNYLPLNLRNISNYVYICGKCFNLKDSEMFRIFLIVCKSKVLFTYRSNFLLKISDRRNVSSSSTSTTGNVTVKGKSVTTLPITSTMAIHLGTPQSNNTTVNTATSNLKVETTTTITSINHKGLNGALSIWGGCTPNGSDTSKGSDISSGSSAPNGSNTSNESDSPLNSLGEDQRKMKTAEKVKEKRRNGKKIKKKKYCRERIINFTDIPEYLLKNFYFDEEECFYINFEKLPTNSSSSSLFSKNNYICKNDNNYVYTKTNLEKHFLHSRVDKDSYAYSTNDSSQTILYADNFESNSDINKENKEINDSVFYCDDEANKHLYTDSATSSMRNMHHPLEDNNYVLCKELQKELINRNSKHTFKRKMCRGCNSDDDKRKECEKVKNVHVRKKTYFTGNFKIKENKFRKFKKKEKIKTNTKGDDTISVYMSDKGWGCMIRVVQMILANILIKYKIYEKYAFFHNVDDYLFYKNFLNKLHNEEYELKKGEPPNKSNKKKETSDYFSNTENYKSIREKEIQKSINNISWEENTKEENMLEPYYFLGRIQTNMPNNSENNATARSCNDVYLHKLEHNKTSKMINEKGKTLNELMREENNFPGRKKRYKNNSIVCLYFRNYESFLNSSDDNAQNMEINNSLVYSVLLQFRDVENAKYSIQNIIYETMKCYNIDQKNMEHFLYEWLGPTSSAVIMSNLINKKKVRFLKKKKKKNPPSHKKFKLYNHNFTKNGSISKKIFFHKDNIRDKNTTYICVKRKNRYSFFSVVFESGIIYTNRVLKFFQIRQKIYVIIWVCLKLGTYSMNISKYKQSILSCFRLKQFQGISSGDVNTSAYYFYSANDRGLFYLDPHIKCQNAFTNLHKNVHSEFFMHKIKFLPWEYLNSSISLVYVVESKEDYFNLIHNLKLIDPSIFEVYDEEPQYRFQRELNFDTDDSGLILL